MKQTYSVYEHNKQFSQNVDKTKMGWAIRAKIQATTGREAASKYLGTSVQRSNWTEVFQGKDVITVCPEVGGRNSHWEKAPA